MQKQDEKDLVVFYDSKAHADYSIARAARGGRRRADGAREAYGQALQEDLSPTIRRTCAWDCSRSG